jgi:Cu-processing system permease protein
MNKIWLLAIKEFSDRFRSGWVIACAFVWLGAVSLTSLFGLIQIGKIGLQGYERTVMSLLSLVQYLVPLLGLLLGHDLLVSEREERTLSLVLASGLPRRSVLLGKFLGGCLTLALPLVLGFTISGTVIGLSAEDKELGLFVKLAVSGLILGGVFVAVGLLVSTFARTRVQALVVSLLAWCCAVFVFDLVAMGAVLVRATPAAARQVEAATDAMHVNAVADMHAAFENGDDAAARVGAQAPARPNVWLLLNPVDLFRTVNLPKDLAAPVPLLWAAASLLMWLAIPLLGAHYKLKHLDL